MRRSCLAVVSEMATGPLPLSGPGWNLHKTKDMIFAHLNDHGVPMNVAKQLLSLEQSEVITKEHGLTLIAAMNASMDEVNVLASPWDLLMPVAQAECGVILDVMEAPGARLALIPIWVEQVLRAGEAASGLTKELIQDDEMAGIDDSSTETSPPPTPGSTEGDTWCFIGQR